MISPLNLELDAITLRCVVEGKGLNALVLGSSIYYPRCFSGHLRQRLSMAFMDLPHFAIANDLVNAQLIDLERYLQYIEIMRCRLGMESMLLIGHSHHGNLALEYAKRFPERVSHLVMIGSPPCNVARTREVAASYWEQHASAQRKSILSQRRQRLGNTQPRTATEGAFIVEYIADAPIYWHDPNFDATSLWQGVPVNIPCLEQFRNFFDAADYVMPWDAVLPQIPVLVVMGRQDYAVPHLLWKDRPGSQANFSYHLLEHSGHTPPLEEPGVFDRIVLDWLAETRSSENP